MAYDEHSGGNAGEGPLSERGPMRYCENRENNEVKGETKFGCQTSGRNFKTIRNRNSGRLDLCLFEGGNARERGRRG